MENLKIKALVIQELRQDICPDNQPSKLTSIIEKFFKLIVRNLNKSENLNILC